MLLNTHSSIENNTTFTSQSFGLEQTPFFFKILSSSLYERKEEAVLRELCANALDAHIMAGIETTPIEVILPNDLSPELIIRDFGTGMSLLSLEQIYTVYGSSTKRLDNVAIGGFGMGSKSPFALSDSFTVESTHEGITTNIACYLDEGHPKFSVFSSTRTNAPSGTTVKVPVSNSENQKLLVKAAETVFSYWTTQPDIKGAKVRATLSDNLLYQNDLVTVTSRNFPIVPYSYGRSELDFVTIGPFYYSIPTNMKEKLKDSDSYKIIKNIQLKGAYVSYTLPFPIGALELAPSRERIEDTVDNYNTIQTRLDTLADFIKGDFFGDVTKQYVNLVNLVKTKGIKESDFKLGNTDKVLAIDPKHVEDFFSGITSSDNNPLTAAYYTNNVFNNIETLLSGLASLSDKDMQNITSLPEHLSGHLLDSTYMSSKDLQKYSKLVPYLEQVVTSNTRFQHLCVRNLLPNPLPEVISTVTKQVDTYELIVDNGKYFHKPTFYSFRESLLEDTTYIVIKGEKEAKTTKLINSVLKEGLLPFTNVFIVYTKEHSVEDTITDLKHYKTIVSAPESVLYTIEDFENKKHLVPKVTRTKAAPSTKSTMPQADKEVANIVLPKSAQATLKVADLYSPEFYTKYTHLVVLQPSVTVNNPGVPPKLTEQLLSDVLILQLTNTSEKNTVRFKALQEHFSTHPKTYRYQSNPYFHLEYSLHDILKESTLKGHKQTMVDIAKTMLFHNIMGASTSDRLVIKSTHNLLFSSTLDTDNMVYPHNLPFPSTCYTMYVSALSHFLNLLPTKVKYLYNSIMKDGFRSGKEGRKVQEDIPSIFTKKELATLRKAHSQTIKALGDLYDSAFKDIIYTNTNTK